MTTQAPIAPEHFARERNSAPPRSHVSAPVAQMMTSLEEAMAFRTGDRDTQPWTAYGPPPEMGQERAPVHITAALIHNRLLNHEIEQISTTMQESMRRAEEQRQRRVRGGSGKGKGKGKDKEPEE